MPLPIEQNLPADLRREFAESFTSAHLTSEVAELFPLSQEIIPQARILTDQNEILAQVFAQTDYSRKEDMDIPCVDPYLHGLTPSALLLEYTTATLARAKSRWEMNAHRNNKIGFAIQDAGMESVFLAFERYSKNTDPLSAFYRWTTADLARGGTVKEQLAQTVGTVSDTHSAGRQLPGHAASAQRSILPVTSWVGGHVLTDVGISQAIALRERLDMQKGWKRFADPQAVSFIYMGDAGMAEGEVKEAADQMLLRGDTPTVFVVPDNGGGISTNASDGAVGEDPIASYRGLEQYGLTIMDVDSTNLQSLFDTARDAVDIARSGRKPVLIHVMNIPKMHNHSTSDSMERYMIPSELGKMKRHDPLPLLRDYFLGHNLATEEELGLIDKAADEFVNAKAQEVLAEGFPDPKGLYENVYAPAFHFGPERIHASDWKNDRTAPLDRLQSTFEPQISYIDHFRKDTFPVAMREAINLTLAQEMKRDPKIIVFGEDVADFSTSTFENLATLFEEKFNLYQEKFHNFLSDAEYEDMRTALEQIQQGKGTDVKPETFALLSAIMGGKGGVFKTTQFLQLLYGPDRVYNSSLAEASIIGTATGLAVAGFTPVVEIQFLPYFDPARNQLKHQLATLRWRSNGQFDAGMVIRVQGMNRLGGVAAMGHGGASIGEYINIPGVRVVMPAHADEAGPLFREALRVAREHREIVLFMEPINQLNTSKGFYQGPDAYIPLGLAEVQQEGDGQSIVVLTWSNNVPLVKEAAKQWATDPTHPFSPTIINMRSLGVETDWETILPYIKKHGKVFIVETERSTASAGADLSAKIAEHLWDLLDGPILRLSARNIRTSAGKMNENYQLPQIEEIVQAGLDLYKF